MEKLNQAFKSTCIALLGSEIGELEEFREYLTEMVPCPMKVKSFATGKTIFLSQQYYSKNANFLELENLSKIKQKLDINEIKDLDSLLNSVKENFSYCGNNNIGNCMEVENSDSCQDGAYILNSHQLLGGKYVAYSHGIRKSEYVFGSVWSGEVGFLIRCHGLFFSRSCYESYLSTKSMNLYFSFNCWGCSEMFLSFNQVSKKYCIGNLELEKEKYFSLKTKLIAEITEDLKKSKKFPSLFEFCFGGDKNE
ncbi:MAG: hypothetical protein WC501_04430 [Candidatus Micrarchaeia archaeon]